MSNARQDGLTMHFDILVPEDQKKVERIYQYGRQYLNSKSFETGQLTSNECKFCHIEEPDQAIAHSINNNGYHIVEMQNCD